MNETNISDNHPKWCWYSTLQYLHRQDWQKFDSVLKLALKIVIIPVQTENIQKLIIKEDNPASIKEIHYRSFLHRTKLQTK